MERTDFLHFRDWNEMRTLAWRTRTNMVLHSKANFITL